MITKERLEELIEQGATIWSEQFREKFLLKDFINIDFFDNGFISCFYNNRELIINLNKVFETQEEAEWYKEFGCIERTERLELPTWEELFKEDRILDCYTQEFGIVKNRSFIEVVLFGVDFTNEIVEVSIGSDQIFCELLTKENYTLACRKAKELFLKGNVND